MSNNKRLKNRRWRLWEENPHCHWCGKKLKWKKSTIDHLDSRLSPERGKHCGTIRTVLSCSPCNNKRGIEETSRLPKYELWIRGNSFPKINKKGLTLIERSIILWHVIVLNKKNLRDVE